MEAYLTQTSVRYVEYKKVQVLKDEMFEMYFVKYVIHVMILKYLSHIIFFQMWDLTSKFYFICL